MSAFYTGRVNQGGYMHNSEVDNYNEYALRWSYAQICEILRKIFDKINHTKVKQEYNITFLLAVSFSKALTTFEEIITLLYNGFPNGALALSRNLYENYVIILFIYSYNIDCPDLLHKYIDYYNYETAKMEKLRNEDILSGITDTGIDNECSRQLIKDAHAAIDSASKKMDIFREKYSSRDFKDYWWAIDILKNPNFAEIQNKLIIDNKLDRAYRAHYKYACTKIHCSFFGIFDNLGDSSDDLYFSRIFDGYEIPLGFSLFIFINHIQLFSSHYDQVLFQNLIEQLCLIAEEYESVITGVG